MTVYLHDWAGCSADDVFRAFDGTRGESYRDDDPVPLAERTKFAGVEILFASYRYANYSAEAFVLFRRDGKLWEVNGSHCSCYELEGQWDPEETTVEALRHRIVYGTLGGDGDHLFADELLRVLDGVRR